MGGEHLAQELVAVAFLLGGLLFVPHEDADGFGGRGVCGDRKGGKQRDDQRSQAVDGHADSVSLRAGQLKSCLWCSG